MAAVTPAQVRAFAVANSLTVGARGTFSNEVVDAYNKANPRAKYVQGSRFTHTVPVAVETRDKAGRKRTKTVQVDPRAAREYAAQNGGGVQTRGRLSKAALATYAATLV